MEYLNKFNNLDDLMEPLTQKGIMWRQSISKTIIVVTDGEIDNRLEEIVSYLGQYGVYVKEKVYHSKLNVTCTVFALK
jgi:hypothetical protein